MINFCGKAGTLLGLKSRIKKAQIPPFLTFTFEAWMSSSSKIIETVNEAFGSEVLIIRSSAANED